MGVLVSLANIAILESANTSAPMELASLQTDVRIATKTLWRTRRMRNEIDQSTTQLKLLQTAIDTLNDLNLLHAEPSSIYTKSMLSTTPLVQILQVDGQEPCPASKPKYYPCQSCSLVFHSEEDLQQHDSYQFYCDICMYNLLCDQDRLKSPRGRVPSRIPLDSNQAEEKRLCMNI